jgi:hypothetical protein
MKIEISDVLDLVPGQARDSSAAFSADWCLSCLPDSSDSN